jgi:acyl-CoA thioester hydrolase
MTVLPAPLPSVEVVTRVEWVDTDAAGIHHNTVITRYAEAAEAELMRNLGIDEYFPVAPRVRFEATYQAPLFFGQEVTTVLRVAQVGSTSLTFEFEVWGEEHQGRPRTRAAVGSYVTVHVPTGLPGAGPHSATAKPWPADWRSRLMTVRSPG